MSLKKDGDAQTFSGLDLSSAINLAHEEISTSGSPIAHDIEITFTDQNLYNLYKEFVEKSVGIPVGELVHFSFNDQRYAWPSIGTQDALKLQEMIGFQPKEEIGLYDSDITIVTNLRDEGTTSITFLDRE